MNLKPSYKMDPAKPEIVVKPTVEEAKSLLSKYFDMKADFAETTADADNWYDLMESLDRDAQPLIGLFLAPALAWKLDQALGWGA